MIKHHHEAQNQDCGEIVADVSDACFQSHGSGIRRCQVLEVRFYSGPQMKSLCPERRLLEARA